MRGQPQGVHGRGGRCRVCGGGACEAEVESRRTAEYPERPRSRRALEGVRRISKRLKRRVRPSPTLLGQVAGHRRFATTAVKGADGGLPWADQPFHDCRGPSTGRLYSSVLRNAQSMQLLNQESVLSRAVQPVCGE